MSKVKRGGTLDRMGMAARPAGRSYHQYCAVAKGLDVVGDRWTLLLVRDLLLGPKRYKDLLAGLPGIGTNLLAARLRDLEAHGLVERGLLPPPAGSAVYRLTEAGAALEPVVLALGRWGSRYLGPRDGADDHLVGPYFVAMRATFRPEPGDATRATWEFRVDGRVFEVRVDGTECSTREASADRPDAVMTMDVLTLNALMARRLPADEAVRSGRVRLDGDPDALRRFVQLFVFRH